MASMLVDSDSQTSLTDSSFTGGLLATVTVAALLNLFAWSGWLTLRLVRNTWWQATEPAVADVEGV